MTKILIDEATVKLVLDEMRRLARLANVDHTENKGVAALEQVITLAEQPAQQEPVTSLAEAIRAEPTELIHKWRVLELVRDHAPQSAQQERGIKFNEGLHQEREARLSQPTQQEPFGYFKAEPFGWTDCAETDEGAVALYTAPQPAQRKPLTLREIGAICGNFSNETIKIVRQTEAAHNIKENT